MNLANQDFEATAEHYKLLARRSINQADLTRDVIKVLKVDDAEEVRTRTKNTIADIVGLFEAGRGNTLPSIRKTYWTAHNGVSAWLSYDRGRRQDSRRNSLWFGDSANLKRHALQTALEMGI
jgi:Domain of unknown function (DUF932)